MKFTIFHSYWKMLFLSLATLSIIISSSQFLESKSIPIIAYLANSTTKINLFYTDDGIGNFAALNNVVGIGNEPITPEFTVSKQQTQSIEANVLVSGLAVNASSANSILVISATSNKFSQYISEILTAEGLSGYNTLDISAVNSSVLDGYDVVLVGNIPLTESHVTMLSNWSNAGGTLVAFRPDTKLAPLLGIAPTGSTLANKYLLVNTTTGPGKGIVNQTIQYQGTADLYTLAGATRVATLYSGANTATAYPAVTMRSVGEQGGTAVAFTFDLARSIVYTRQGNPQWAGQKRDGQAGPIRSDDQFYPDWIDLSKVMIPQADEQQRLLANIITLSARKPLPRFWYLPRGLKAAVVMTGDDHGNGGTKARFNQYLQLSSDNSAEAVADWRAIRGTSYIYPNTPLTDAEAKAFEQQGFEVALHLTTNCANFTPTSLEQDLTSQLAAFRTRYPSVAPPSTNRTHCIAWSDWHTQPKLEAPKGIRLDANYYYWPSPWVQNRPGMFTGSGIPMRFADLDGGLIDVYQLTTQMTDESDQTFPYTIDQLLNKALGAEGYYGVFCANMHTDANTSEGSDAIIASAKARNVPVISSKQLLTWLDGRNGSSFSSLIWNEGELTFSVSVANGARSLLGMLPITEASGRLVRLTRNGVEVQILKTEYIKGVEYAFFPASTGTFVATYDLDTPLNQAPVVSLTAPASNATFTAPAAITLTADASDADGTVSRVEFYNGAQLLSQDTDGSNGWSYTWNDVPAGNYTLTARAYDNSGASTTSSGTNIEILAVCPCTVFLPSASPATNLKNDGQAIQVGMKFRSTQNGYVSGVRFYKQSGNTGTHTGQLYSSTGTLLASVAFTSETASGWQQAAFSSPVAITAGTTYVISYHSSAGNYASDYSYFSQTVVNGPLRALANGEEGPNGVYRYTNTPAFPGSDFQASNYWVDVVFSPDDSPVNQTPVVSLTAPANNATFTTPATITLTASASDADGTVSRVEFYNGAQLLGQDTDGSNGWSYTWNDVPAGNYTLTARAYDNSGASSTSAVVNILVNPGQIVCPCSVFQPSAAPTNALYNDGQAIQVGMKFRSTQNGYVSGVRFYKQSGNTGTHTGQLYSSTGTLLASVAFTSETASGWQQAAFSSPVAITAGTTYVISYHSSAGGYSANNPFFTQAVENGPLRALASGEDGPNGIYKYSAQPTFPDEYFLSANYWVDVVFSPGDAPVNQAPVVSITAPANNAIFTAPVSVTITANATDEDGAVSKVEFYSGEEKLGEDANGSNGWSFAWSDVPAASYTLTARATDDKGSVTTSSAVNITVNAPANQPPVIAITSPTEGANFTNPASIRIVSTASDPDGTVSKVEFYNGETKLGEATASPYEYTWSSVSAGSYQLMAKATDNAGAVTNSEVVNVSVSTPENRPPVVANPIADQTAVVGVAFNFTVDLNTFADPDEDPLTYTASLTDGAILPSWLVFNGSTRTFSGTPPAESQAQLSIRVLANDGRGGTVSDDFTLTINQPVNQAPVLATIGNKTVNELSILTFMASATDDGLPSGILSYSLISPVSEASINPSTGAFSWTPTEAQGPGTYTFTVKVTDGELTDEEEIVVQVAEVNQAPVLASVGNKEIGVGQTLLFTLQGADADIPEQVLSYSANKLPAGATLSANTGAFSWAPTSRQVGSHKIIFRVSDGISIVSESITITVSSTPIASTPVIAGFSPASGSAGDQVLISGSNFSDVSAVAFNGVQAVFNVNDASAITAYVPAGATTGRISVTSPGGTALSGASFTVSGSTGVAPSVSITAPANGSSYNAPASIAISASASDTDGTVIRVEFFQGNTKIGEDTDGTDGWNMLWNGVVAGNYALTARAIDNTVLATTSDVINVSVISTSTGPPLVTSFSPTSGPVGESVLISGNNLSTATKVTFGPSNAVFTVNGDGNLVAIVPAVNGKLPTGVKITVSTPSGNSTTSNKFTITSGLAANTVSTLQQSDLKEGEEFMVYPNPFSDKAMISIILQEDSEYHVRLYDYKGALVDVLKYGHAKAGEQYEVEVDGSKLAKGLYLVRLQTNAGSRTVKLVLDR